MIMTFSAVDRRYIFSSRTYTHRHNTHPHKHTHTHPHELMGQMDTHFHRNLSVDQHFAKSHLASSFRRLGGREEMKCGIQCFERMTSFWGK